MPGIINAGYELVDVAKLTEHPDNPRRGDLDAISASIDAHGFYGTIVAQRSTGRILAGNHRYRAAKQAGAAELPVVWVDVDDESARRILAADNRTSDLGSYDSELLAVLLGQLAETEAGLLGTGYTDNDLSELLATINQTIAGPTLTDPDEVPDAPASPITKPGDLWQLGPHRVLCGDATVPTDLDRVMAGDQADCMWTDPPYGVNYVGKTDEAMTISNDGPDDLPDLIRAAFTTATTVLKPGAAVYVAHPPGALSLVFGNAFVAVGWRLHQRLVWVKDQMVLGHSDYHYRHEDILYGYTSGPGRRGRGGDGWYGDHAQTSVFDIARPKRSEDHPTTKPVELIARCLSNSCPPRGITLDPFAGSGTTLLAAHGLGMRARLVELDAGYVDVICRRFQQHTGQLPVLEATGEPVDFDRAGGDD